jgi:hypothetical protein
MYATVRRYEMGAGSRGAGAVQELMRKCEEQFLPVISKVEGFVSYYAVDAGDGRIASISIFESEAGADEGNKAVKHFWKEVLSGLLQANPQVTSGAVLAHNP